jgi:hypothetical protein
MIEPSHIAVWCESLLRVRTSRGLPETDRERAEQRRRFAEEHRETLRRGK